MPLFGVTNRSPGPLSVVTVHADPVSCVIEKLAPIERLPPPGQLGWPRFVRLPPVRSFLTVTRGSVPHRRCLCPVPTPLHRRRCRLRCALFGTISSKPGTKPLVKGYFRSHRVVPRHFSVVPRISSFIHRSSTVRGLVAATWAQVAHILQSCDSTESGMGVPISGASTSPESSRGVEIGAPPDFTGTS